MRDYSFVRGFGETTTDEGLQFCPCVYKIWYCGEDEKHQYGGAFIVRLVS